MKAGLAAALAVWAALAGCGGEAGEAIDETADNLGDLRSGQLSVKLLVSPSVEGSDIGFELDGQFELSRRDGELPHTRLRYIQIAGARRGGVDFISNADGAWVGVKGQAYELPPGRVDRLRGAGPVDGGEGPLGDLDLTAWTSNEKTTENGSSERITADLEPVEALNDAIDVLGEVGGGDAVGSLRPLKGKQAEALERAVRSAKLSLITGKRDRLLRRMSVTLEIGADAPKELAGGLGDLSGARVSFDLRITRPNKPVDVPTPDGALPFESLPRG